MKSGNHSKESIVKRIGIISNMEYILKESIYYRTHSLEFKSGKAFDICSLDKKINKTKIL